MNASSAGVDPTSTAYRVHTHVFNTLTTMLGAGDRFVPLSERDAIASAIVEVIEPIIRADERAQPAQAASGSLRAGLEALVNFWAVGGNGINAASQDLISACSAELLRVLDEHPGAALEQQAAPGHMMVMRGTIALREAEIERLRERLAAADGSVRGNLESLCRRDGLSLDSYIDPGEPARNYALAERLGIGHVFGLEDDAKPHPVPAPDSEAGQ
jgi:hypothetical protein